MMIYCKIWVLFAEDFLREFLAEDDMMDIREGPKCDGNIMAMMITVTMIMTTKIMMMVMISMTITTTTMTMTITTITTITMTMTMTMMMMITSNKVFCGVIIF